MQRLTDLNTFLSLAPDKLVNTTLICPECEQEHPIPFKIVQSGEHLISAIPELINQVLGHEPEFIGLIYDQHLETKLRPLFFDPFHELGQPFMQIPLGAPGHLLEASVEIADNAAEKISENIGFLIGIGSGVISDLTKWIATKKQLPFLLLGTALSMNAYTSITGTMTENKVKSSRWLNPADIVILDNVLTGSAPIEMTYAGYADILARNIANADWKLSQILRGTYFCSVPFLMMSNIQESIIQSVYKSGLNTPETMRTLADGVLVSGFTMTVLNGETSPSSGSEHILSHFFDFQHNIFNLPKNLHGTQVGLGTIIMSAAYHLLLEINPLSLDLEDIERRRLSKTAWTLDHQRLFGKKSKLFDQVYFNKRIDDIEFRPYIQQIIHSWDEILAAISPYLLPSDAIREAMVMAGAPTRIKDINRTQDEVIEGLLYGSHYRTRYTVLDLFWELGLFPASAVEILERAQVLD